MTDQLRIWTPYNTPGSPLFDDDYLTDADLYGDDSDEEEL